VLRKYSPSRVIGGGIVLDPSAEARRRTDRGATERLKIREQGDPETILLKQAERAGVAGLENKETDENIAAALIARKELIAIAGRVYHRAAIEDLTARTLELARAHQARQPLQWGMGKEELRQRLSFPHPAGTFNAVIEFIGTTQPVFMRGDRVRVDTPDVDLPPALRRATEDLASAVRAAGIAFPSRADLEKTWTSRERLADALQYLREAGEIQELGDGVMHTTVFRDCVERVRGLFAQQPELAVSDLRDALGISRKHAVPLLEYLDAGRFTVRKGNVRVPGSALNQPPAPR
jgi:selenocysteine-specific elongation factor